jgi:thioredoxin-related protein
MSVYAYVQLSDEMAPRPGGSLSALAVPTRFAQLERAVSYDRVLVIMFTRPSCAFCEALRREHLLPMQAALKTLASPQISSKQSREDFALEPAAAKRITLWELDLTSRKTFENSAGVSPAATARWQAHAQALAESLQIRLTPTLAFFGAKGEVAERLVGYGSRDFFGAYLEQRLEAALSATRI